MRVLLFTLLCIFCLSGIGYLFWIYEWQYNAPTPVPENLKAVKLDQEIDSALRVRLNITESEKVFIHFYNSDCPCSRFNSKEFKSLVYKYDDDIRFIAVVEGLSSAEKREFKAKYDLGIPIFWDNNEYIAEALGVYSTPQAVIIKDGKLYYKGNYNRARFCTSRNTKFAEIALTNLLENKAAPNFPELATVAYGCELPSNETENNFLIF